MESLRVKQINKLLFAAHNDVRIAHILNKYQDKVLITTSFGTTSALLIHMISRIRQNHPIHFINTGHLFPETLKYKNRLIERYGINVIEHVPDKEKHSITKKEKLWKSNPDLCCHYNKVEPLEKIKANHEVWISGLIGYQNSYRSELEILQQRDDLHRFYPLIDWTPEMVDDYFESYGIPRHPLERFGFHSIGCTHCTTKGDGRDGRWGDSDKTECGLHW
ncbi:MAG: phosphoadenylyl-sulfate reductase [Gracilimonas sp.]|uniref:phosphoadenylyl-sulfate reductase n=1 Tax=Gracilimonas sp. TaxID=1974203 RepID=UPI0019BA4109|nr:phosphoadenylyl-sulfate reductase [Gracilimonas sp.]MBD3617317.1 phosphoadenylyl-sulfate reductase [Gracilimonas sp.]